MTNKIYEIFSNVMEIPLSEISDDLNVESVSQWDSFNHLVLLDEIEQEFGISLPLDEFSKVKQIGDLKHLLKKQNISNK